MKQLAYLGPEGTFTHQAAIAMAGGSAELVPVSTVGAIYGMVGSEEIDAGIVAIESTVEGYVVPSLDAIVGAANVIAIDEIVLDITFDAFTHHASTEASTAKFTEVTAHPHGLAQCEAFVARSGLLPVPAASNAAACRDIAPYQVALGPRICGELYNLHTLERGVEDFHGARTRFLLIVARNTGRTTFAQRHRTDASVGSWRTMLAITPHLTGSGVLARITREFGAGGVNLSSLITRPLKAQEGKYVFVLTVDAAPWAPEVRDVFRRLLDGGNSLKTLGVFPGRQNLDEALDLDRIPAGSVQAASAPADQERGLLWE